jgi:hypothetical protein
MSAYVVRKETLDRALTLLLFEGVVKSPEELNEFGRKLWNMNVDAVEQLYRQHDWIGERAKAQLYVYEQPKVDSLAQYYKSLRCLRYQCAEGDVPQTPLYRTLDEVCERPHLKKLEGTDVWNRADWG